jgi:hypothetical protein
VLRGRGFSMRATLIERIVRSNKVQKMAGFITKQGRGIVRSVPTEAEASKKSPERGRPLGAVGCAGRIEAIHNRLLVAVAQWPPRNKKGNAKIRQLRLSYSAADASSPETKNAETEQAESGGFGNSRSPRALISRMVANS